MSISDYEEFKARVLTGLPPERVIDDPLYTLAFGTDASFYRLIPKIVVSAENEAEVALILKAAHEFKVPVTFRAAGTSLSGQAITDSVLVVAAGAWKAREILENGAKIRLQPGVIGAHANRFLAPYGRKIGPDPASINAAMIGGIAANNASGMCCGTAQNSYRTVSSIRVLLSDGTLLDTGNPESREQFRQSHSGLLGAIEELGARVRQDADLAGRIRHKFKIKNTTGYSLNALVDFEDPYDILLHLMIGSEGTLGFISEITYHTVAEDPFKASAMIIFPDISPACLAITVLAAQEVAAAELMDRASLGSVENKPGMPDYLKTLPDGAAALLVETRAATSEVLANQIAEITGALQGLNTLSPIAFTDRVAEFTALWNIRKGLFPAVGAIRRIGTTVIIEDVAFPVERLADATLDLQVLLQRYHYHEAIIFGHALAGNLHFVFTQDFSAPSEVQRYKQFMADVGDMVVHRYDGSLKAEHGTGRNMAPFVEMEWGAAAYDLMKRIKAIFDPQGLLNPGVVLNESPEAHVEHLKPLPQTHPLVDKCTECGFCEPSCPSRNLTLTPRQRIVIRREISRLAASGSDPQRLAALTAGYDYPGEQTCAADGLCGVNCPVAINTGELTKVLRSQIMDTPGIQKTADWVAGHFDTVTAGMRLGLKAVDAAHRILGTRTMQRLAQTARAVSGNRLPLWNRAMPVGIPGPRPGSGNGNKELEVVYFPSCVARTMGPAKGDPDTRPLYRVTESILGKAGYGVIYPENLAGLCCGMPFDSKGLFKQAERKSRELEAALLEASRGGELPVLCDTSPCLHRMRETMTPLLRLFEPVEFVHDFLMDRLQFTQLPETAAVHVTCSSTQMGLDPKFRALAAACLRQAIFPDAVSCCGFAGDRGFTHPELNDSALRGLQPAVADATLGYSNSRTCEIGLTLHSGIPYQSILYLVDRCTG